ncbi:MAG: hypothetical protein PHG38_10220 [Bacteroidales bacterium]|jgi:hypothetical protein|nr:hypothetical protein [Bacteroidales bacterium]MDD4655160.1 hypothetical protein [Bacteroidales bacterium]MDD4827723.1 hypothetical protein [Bacteroidales bacterium]
MNKISKITLWILMAVSAVFTVLYYMNIGGEGEDAWTYAFLTWAYIVMGVALLLIVVLPLLTLKQRTIKVKSILLFVLFAVVVVGGAYLLAPAEPVHLAAGKIVEGMSVKLTETSLFITYFLLAVSVLAIIGGSVYNAVKKN